MVEQTVLANREFNINARPDKIAGRRREEVPALKIQVPSQLTQTQLTPRPFVERIWVRNRFGFRGSGFGVRGSGVGFRGSRFGFQVLRSGFQVPGFRFPVPLVGGCLTQGCVLVQPHV